MSKDLQYAGFEVRLIGCTIDLIILYILLFFLITFIKLVIGGIPDIFFIISLFMQIINLIIPIGYYAYSESSNYQATLGKRFMKIKVVGKDGERISFSKALGRSFAQILSLISLCIGYIMIAFDRKKQGLHDKLASTYVVKVD